MKFMAALPVAAVTLALATAALSQSGTSPPAAQPASPVTNNQAPPVPVPTTRRMACQAAAQGKQGQDRHDLMQLCMAQARLDCLRQAVDQKIVGPERREFVKSCVGL
jgi:hypothetical protein